MGWKKIATAWISKTTGNIFQKWGTNKCIIDKQKLTVFATSISSLSKILMNVLHIAGKWSHEEGQGIRRNEKQRKWQICG